MKLKNALTMAAVVVLLTIAGQVNAEVLTFDDVATINGAVIPNGYGGLDWDNMRVAHKYDVPVSGYYNGTVSGDWTAYNAWGTAASVSDGIFDFQGAYLTAAWNTGLNINLKGYNSGSLIYDQTVVVDSDGPTWFNFNFNAIDNLVFESFGGVDDGIGEGSGTHFAMDDFTYVIPEPSSVAMIGLISGCGVFIRRRFMI